MGKGEIARYEQFLLFPQCFLLKQIIVSPFVHIFAIISLFTAELEEPKTGISGKGLIRAKHEIGMDMIILLKDKGPKVRSISYETDLIGHD